MPKRATLELDDARKRVNIAATASGTLGSVRCRVSVINDHTKEMRAALAYAQDLAERYGEYYGEENGEYYQLMQCIDKIDDGLEELVSLVAGRSFRRDRERDFSKNAVARLERLEARAAYAAHEAGSASDEDAPPADVPAAAGVHNPLTRAFVGRVIEKHRAPTQSFRASPASARPCSKQ